MQNLPLCFMGARPMRESWKFFKGVDDKGPAVRQRATSFARFSSITLRFVVAQGISFDDLGAQQSHSYPICASCCSSEHSASTNDLSGWFSRSYCLHWRIRDIGNLGVGQGGCYGCRHPCICMGLSCMAFFSLLKLSTTPGALCPQLLGMSMFFPKI